MRAAKQLPGGRLFSDYLPHPSENPFPPPGAHAPAPLLLPHQENWGNRVYGHVDGAMQRGDFNIPGVDSWVMSGGFRLRNDIIKYIFGRKSQFPAQKGELGFVHLG